MFVRWKRKRRKDQFTGEWRLTGEWREFDPWFLERYPDLKETSYQVRERIIREEWLLTASLAESVRVNGQPRQRTIRYLGSIREHYLDPSETGSTSRRLYFWRNVEWNLDQLALPSDERTRIVAMIEDRVPAPAPDDIQRHKEQMAEAEQRIRLAMAMTGSV